MHWWIFTFLSVKRLMYTYPFDHVPQAGDSIPADCVLFEEDKTICVNESALTGEPDDIEKKKTDDCFLLSSCVITEAENKVKALVIGTIDPRHVLYMRCDEMRYLTCDLPSLSFEYSGFGTQ